MEAVECLENNIEDITLRSWVMDMIDRGPGYDLGKFAKHSIINPVNNFFQTCIPIYPITSVKEFISGFAASVGELTNFFKDITLILILWHFAKKILVINLLFCFII